MLIQSINQVNPRKCTYHLESHVTPSKFQVARLKIENKWLKNMKALDNFGSFEEFKIFVQQNLKNSKISIPFLLICATKISENFNQFHCADKGLLINDVTNSKKNQGNRKTSTFFDRQNIFCEQPVVITPVKNDHISITVFKLITNLASAIFVRRLQLRYIVAQVSVHLFINASGTTQNLITKCKANQPNPVETWTK